MKRNIITFAIFFVFLVVVCLISEDTVTIDQLTETTDPYSTDLYLITKDSSANWVSRKMSHESLINALAGAGINTSDVGLAVAAVQTLQRINVDSIFADWISIESGITSIDTLSGTILLSGLLQSEENTGGLRQEINFTDPDDAYIRLRAKQATKYVLLDTAGVLSSDQIWTWYKYVGPGSTTFFKVDAPGQEVSLTGDLDVTGTIYLNGEELTSGGTLEPDSMTGAIVLDGVLHSPKNSGLTTRSILQLKEDDSNIQFWGNDGHFSTMDSSGVKIYKGGLNVFGDSDTIFWADNETNRIHMYNDTILTKPNTYFIPKGGKITGAASYFKFGTNTPMLHLYDAGSTAYIYVQAAGIQIWPPDLGNALITLGTTTTNTRITEEGYQLKVDGKIQVKFDGPAGTQYMSRTRIDTLRIGGEGPSYITDMIASADSVKINILGVGWKAWPLYNSKAP